MSRTSKTSRTGLSGLFGIWMLVARNETIGIGHVINTRTDCPSPHPIRVSRCPSDLDWMNIWESRYERSNCEIGPLAGVAVESV